MKKSVKLLNIMILTLVVVIGMPAFLTFITQNHKKKEFQIVFLPNAMPVNDFMASIEAGATLSALDHKASLTILPVDKHLTAEKQAMMIEEALKMSPDAFVIAPLDSEKLKDALIKIKDKKIPVVIIDSSCNQSDVTSVISANHRSEGESLGAYMASILFDGSIGIIGYDEHSVICKERVEGIKKGLGKKESLIEAVIPYEFSYVKTQSLIKELIAMHPNMRLILSMDAASAVSAGRVVSDMEKESKEEKVKIVSFGSSKQLAIAMEQGVVLCMLVEKPFNIGYLSVENAVYAGQEKDVEKQINSQFKLITMDNLYDIDNQKLLFPIRTDK